MNRLSCLLNNTSIKKKKMVWTKQSTLENRKTSGAIQFTVQPSLSEKPGKCEMQISRKNLSYVECFFMGRKTSEGYLVEGRIMPKEGSGFKLKEGSAIGFDIAVDDGKEPNTENKIERKSQMVWLGTANNYKDTSGWGKFRLGK